MAGSPVIGRRRGGVLNITAAPGLRASFDGVLVLATKSEHKMLASTSKYMLVLALCLVVVVIIILIQADAPKR